VVTRFPDAVGGLTSSVDSSLPLPKLLATVRPGNYFTLQSTGQDFRETIKVDDSGDAWVHSGAGRACDRQPGG
jgi:hypothetical protein